MENPLKQTLYSKYLSTSTCFISMDLYIWDILPSLSSRSTTNRVQNICFRINMQNRTTCTTCTNNYMQYSHKTLIRQINSLKACFSHAMIKQNYKEMQVNRDQLPSAFSLILFQVQLLKVHIKIVLFLLNWTFKKQDVYMYLFLSLDFQPRLNI